MVISYEKSIYIYLNTIIQNLNADENASGFYYTVKKTQKNWYENRTIKSEENGFYDYIISHKKTNADCRLRIEY